MGLLSDRRKADTERRIEKIRSELRETESLLTGKACVYATGSFGRLEASVHSDLDLFIVGKSTIVEERECRMLTRLNEFCVKADLIRATRKLAIPEFSGDGEYLKHYTVERLVHNLGRAEDDAQNTFTARLLLLLESQPLLGTDVYDAITKRVIDAYWRDYEDHENEFMPAYLANDILRLWRTFCVNYEARTLTAPPEKKARRKLKNYKLKHSRLWTCYSALLYLLEVFRQRQTVRPSDAVRMISLTPTERLGWLSENVSSDDTRSGIMKLLELYESFLTVTEIGEEKLVSQFLDKNTSYRYIQEAYEFGNAVFEVLSAIGLGNRFFRLLVV